MGGYLAGLPADRYPTIAALATLMMTGDGDERFAFGLDLLIEGLKSQTERVVEP